MADQEWLSEMGVLQAALGASDLTSEDALRLTLAQLWLQLQSCPLDIFTAFRQIRKSVLEEARDRFVDALAEGRLIPLDASDTQEIALQIGGQLWAIEEILADRPGFAQAPASPASFLVEEMGVYVVPRRTPKVVDDRTGPGRGFGRRGTPFHRIIPRRVDKHYTIELVWDTRLSAGRSATPDRKFGAALLPGMTLERDPEHSDWVALSSPCGNDFGYLQEQVEGFYAGAPVAVVYPELSMPPERRRTLCELMRDKSQRMEIGKGPVLVAAGSWHEREFDGIRNVMTVLDQSGVERLRYCKSTAYHRDGVQEGIVVDNTIPILVNMDFLATFAICLDFCEQERPNPYLHLDVDFVLVASLGNLTTVKGHEAKAGEVGSKFGCRSFVVQQADDRDGPPGYVVPGDRQSEGLGESRAWSTRTMRLP